MRIGSWNIGGGRIKSESGTYADENLSYFENQLNSVDCDLVCLQEAHAFASGQDDNQVKSLANNLGYENHWCIPISESHLQKDAQLAIGAMGKTKFNDVQYLKLRNPELTSIGPDGKPWRTFDKGFATATFSSGNAEICLVTGHSFPFHHFQRNPTEASFSDINKMIDDLIVAAGNELPCVALIDLNFDKPELLLPRAFAAGFRPAFSGVATIPKNRQWDHILFSPDFDVTAFQVIRGVADHYLITADLRLNTK
jgi:endonuclease/exonuclease/phosphatase family metal-dependent hydrolase